MVTTTVLWIWSRYAQWQRIDVTYQKVTDAVGNDGVRTGLARVEYHGLLFEHGNVVLHRYRDPSVSEAAPESHSGWEFNERVVGRNLREPGQWLWVASRPG